MAGLQNSCHCASVRLTCPVPAADTLLDNLTVEEMLLYTAEMKNPVALPLAAKRARVDLVLEQLALTGCRGVQIGNALSRGISGASTATTCNHITLARQHEVHGLLQFAFPWQRRVAHCT